MGGRPGAASLRRAAFITKGNLRNIGPPDGFLRRSRLRQQPQSTQCQTLSDGGGAANEGQTRWAPKADAPFKTLPSPRFLPPCRLRRGPD